MAKAKLMQWVEQRHAYWWDTLCHDVKTPVGTDLDRPECRFNDKVSSFAGKANTTWCEYNLNYVFMMREQFDETIAHEVCHTFVNRVRKVNSNLFRVNGGHGPLFFYLYNVILEVNRNECHHYPKCILTDEVKAIRKIKKLQAQINAMNDDVE